MFIYAIKAKYIFIKITIMGTLTHPATSCVRAHVHTVHASPPPTPFEISPPLGLHNLPTPGRATRVLCMQYTPARSGPALTY